MFLARFCHSPDSAPGAAFRLGFLTILHPRLVAANPFWASAFEGFEGWNSYRAVFRQYINISVTEAKDRERPSRCTKARQLRSAVPKGNAGFYISPSQAVLSSHHLPFLISSTLTPRQLRVHLLRRVPSLSTGYVSIGNNIHKNISF